MLCRSIQYQITMRNFNKTQCLWNIQSGFNVIYNRWKLQFWIQCVYFPFFESELYCIIKARSFNVCIGITAGLVTDERLDLFNVMNCFWGAVLVDLDQNFPDWVHAPMSLCCFFSCLTWKNNWLLLVGRYSLMYTCWVFWHSILFFLYMMFLSSGWLINLIKMSLGLQFISCAVPILLASISVESINIFICSLAKECVAVLIGLYKKNGAVSHVCLKNCIPITKCWWISWLLQEVYE